MILHYIWATSNPKFLRGKEDFQAESSQGSDQYFTGTNNVDSKINQHPLMHGHLMVLVVMIILKGVAVMIYFLED